MSFWRITKKQKQEVINGFRLVGGLLLGCLLIGSVVVGLGEAFGTIRESNISSLPKPGALAVALCSFVLISLMVQRWAKYFAGFALFGVLNSLIGAGIGHALNNPSITVERWIPLSMAVIWFTTWVVSRRFTNGNQLKLMDKFALLFWVLAFALFFNLSLANKPESAVAMLAIGSLGLVIAWYYQRHQRTRRGGPSQLLSQHSVEG